MPDAILEKNERDPFEEFKTQMQALREKFNSPIKRVQIENTSSTARLPNEMWEDRFATKETVERLENEIVELKNVLAAQSTVIRQLEQRLAKLQAA